MVWYGINSLDFLFFFVIKLHAECLPVCQPIFLDAILYLLLLTFPIFQPHAILYCFDFSLNVMLESQSMDIERFSDWGKPKNTSKRDSLNQVLQLQSHNFPKELIGGL